MTVPLLALAVQVAQAAQQAVEASASSESLKPYFLSAVSIYYLQKWMKQRSTYARFVAAFPGADKWAHRAVALVWSFLFALGVHSVYSGDLSHGYHAEIDIPALGVLVERAKDFVTVYLSQQITYEWANKPAWQPVMPAPITDKG